jgi:tetratricopeptide (TPR) repeat protein
VVGSQQEESTMAEHNGGNRGGNRGNFGGNRDDRGSYRPNNNSGGDPRGFRSRENRDGSDRPARDGERRPFNNDRGDRKPFGDRGDRPAREGERRSFGDRPARDGERRPFNNDRGDRKPFGDRGDRPAREGERRSFGDRPARDGERRSFGDRPARDGERRPFNDRGERKPFGDRDRKPFGDRGDRPARDGERRPFNNDRGDRKPFGDRPARDGERRSFGGDRDRKPFGDRGDRPARDGERRSFGDRPARDGERRPFNNDRGDRKPFGDRDRKPFGDRGDRGDRPARDGDRRSFDGDRGERGNSWEERPARVPNAKDIRSANRPDRERSPEIDEDVTGKELDRATGHQIKTLEEQSAGWVAKHLVMAGRLIDIEPELAFQHALAASRRGGRLSAVREAVGLTAYAAGHYGEALREFRTYRRISGSNVHLPVMADCERGLGRPDRALDMVRSPEAQDLDAPGKVELAIVASGARADLNQLDAAVSELEIAQLDLNRAFSYSPRLFRAYAEALSAVGRTEEADKWARQALVAENALGVGDFAEPEILDLGWDEREEEAARKPRFQKPAPEADVVKAETETVIAEAAAADVEHDDVELDDAESDYFESDDAESDIDSAEDDEEGKESSEADNEGNDSQHG